MSIIGDHLTEDNSGMYGPTPEEKAIELLRAELQTAVHRINDMLNDPDGQSFKEARKWVDRTCYVHGLKNEPKEK